MRLLILILLVYFGYRVLKRWVLPGGKSETLEKAESLGPVDDVMVKDPFCHAYFPKRQGVQDVIDGQTHYFCSTECRDKYREAAKTSDGD